jgi:HTH-type transcriptional regulator/antitoxin HipB
MIVVRAPSELGAAIREQRRRQALSQADLAERIGVNRRWVVDIERGKDRAELGLVLRALEALGIRLLIDDGRRASRADPVAAPDIDEVVHRARGPSR